MSTSSFVPFLVFEEDGRRGKESTVNFPFPPPPFLLFTVLFFSKDRKEHPPLFLLSRNKQDCFRSSPPPSPLPPLPFSPIRGGEVTLFFIFLKGGEVNECFYFPPFFSALPLQRKGFKGAAGNPPFFLLSFFRERREVKSSFFPFFFPPKDNRDVILSKGGVVWFPFFFFFFFLSVLHFD